MREIDDVETPIIKMIEQAGGYTINYIIDSTEKRGVPDILACINGRFFGIECKRKGQSYLTPVQKKNLIAIAKSGGVAVVVKTPEEFKQVLDVYNGEQPEDILTIHNTSDIKIYSDTQYTGVIRHTKD